MDFDGIAVYPKSASATDFSSTDRAHAVCQSGLRQLYAALSRNAVTWLHATYTIESNRMPLPYQPKEGSIFICDFSGFVAPEMVKQRPVVVLRKHPHNSRLVTIVPLSTTAPEKLAAHHVELPCYLPGESEICWAKCDMVYTVSIDRLDRAKIRTRHQGRQYVNLAMSAEHFTAVKGAVLAGLNL